MQIPNGHTYFVSKRFYPKSCSENNLIRFEISEPLVQNLSIRILNDVYDYLLGVTTARKVLPLASGIKSNLVPRLRKKPGNEVGSKVPPRDQRQHAQFAEYGAVYMILLILVPRALLTRGATRGSGQIHIRTGI
jgi:hypothetical protein